MTPDTEKCAACLSIVAPAYNEKPRLAHVGEKLLAVAAPARSRRG